MDDQRFQFNNIVSTASLLTLLAVSSFLLFDRPFQPERPPSDLSASAFETRLWEDPLKAVFAVEDRAEQIVLSGRGGAAEELNNLLAASTMTPDAFRKSTDVSAANGPILIGVLLPDSRSALESETRRRIRYAILSAVNQTHVPASSESIRILNANPRGPRQLLSHEVFRAVKSSATAYVSRDVVVLWIPEKALEGSVLSGYARILDTLHTSRSAIPDSVLIGPTSSNGLVALARELRPAAANSGEQALASIDVADAALEDAVAALIADANGYLDVPLDDMQRAAVMACFGAADAEVNRVTAESCLVGLNIEDSDPEWYKEVARRWPHPILGTIPEPLREDAGNLMESADRYLDDGLQAKHYELLARCLTEADRAAAQPLLTRERAAACLKALDIADSDVTWYDTVAIGWPSTALATALQTADASRRADLRRVIEASDRYLDKGMPASSYGPLIECLRTSNTASVLDRASVSACLAGLQIEDSNPNWHKVIASDWPAEEVVMALGDLAEPVRGPLRDLLASAQSYLDNGLDDAAQILAIKCLAPYTTLSAINGEQARTCLEGTNVTDSDEDWARTIASSWWAQHNSASLKPENKVVVISPRATLSREALLSAGAILPTSLGDNRLIRAVATDDLLLDRIYTELTDVRRLDEKTARIALVYESDTEYGRALENALICRDDAAPAAHCFPRANVQSFSYLRGIDGLVSEGGSASGAGADASTSNQLSLEAVLSGAQQLEDPFGKHQFDYLRRLSAEISQQSFAAIGVLGTDIFDKLLVLEALHDRNPDAVFFTTDLDSRIGRGVTGASAQNLLLASSFSLESPRNPARAGTGPSTGNSCAWIYDSSGSEPPVGNGQIASPPFRDNYQTAYFYSMCYALRLQEIGRTKLKDRIESQTDDLVHLYEVGRNGPVELDSAATAGVGTRHDLEDIILLNLAWGILMLPTLLVLLTASWRLANLRAAARGIGNGPEIPATWTCIGISAGTLLLMTALLITEAITPLGEPLAIAQGISHWPATLLRIQVLELSLCFHFYAFAVWKANSHRIDNLLGSSPPKESPAQDAPASVGAWIRVMNAENAFRRAERPFDDIWATHRGIARWSPQRLRMVALKSTLLTAVILATYYWLTPHPHLVRNSFALANFLFGEWFLALVTFVAVTTMVIANDVVRLNRALIRALHSYDVTRAAQDHAGFTSDSYSDPAVGLAIFKLEFIAMRTRDIQLSMLFPFCIILMAIVSRSTLFEGWQWSVPLILLYLSITAFLLYCVVMLQVEASRAKARTLDLLNLQQKHYYALERTERETREFELNAALRHVRNLNRGAFASWYRHPVLLAMALPTSGTSGLLLLQQFF